MKKSLKIVLITAVVFVLVVGLVMVALRIAGHRMSDPLQIESYQTTNQYIKKETDKIAHRCGAGIAPQESLLAMKTCIERDDIQVDMYEFDLRITKDKELVVFHDITLDKTTDAEIIFGEKDIKVCDMTLNDLKKLNVGAKFVDENGETPYASLEKVPDELRILTLQEALDYLTSQGVERFSIECKDKGELGLDATTLLYNELKARDLLDTTIYSSFDKEVSTFAKETYPDMTISNNDAQAFELYVAAITNDEDYVPPCTVFQVPYTDKYLNIGVNFGSAKVINFAHKNNIAVHYWTVNDAQRMEYLQSIGADGIMTDYPDLLTKTLK